MSDEIKTLSEQDDGAKRLMTVPGIGPIISTATIAAIKEYRAAGCTHVMLELWGEDRHEQIRLFGEQVLPHVRG